MRATVAMAGESESTAPPKTWGSRVSKVFSHPFVLALFGGGVTVFLSGIMVPRITQEWQNRQEQLTLETSLVSDMSNSVARFIATVDSYELRNNLSRDSYEKAYYNWEVQSEAILSRLQAYFPHTHIPQEWQTYVRYDVDALFFLSEIDPSQKYESREWIQQLNPIRVTLSADRQKQVNWKLLAASTESVPLAGDIASAWQGLDLQVLNQKNDVIQEVLSSTIEYY
ncbi:MAG TPA: hypothetical protein VF221_01200 [Chloroflexota bacterium]